jgi:hypothetical protein
MTLILKIVWVKRFEGWLVAERHAYYKWVGRWNLALGREELCMKRESFEWLRVALRGSAGLCGALRGFAGLCGALWETC